MQERSCRPTGRRMGASRSHNPGIPRRTFRVSELSSMLSIPRATLYRLVRTGEIGSLRIGRLVLVPVDELEDLLRRHRVPARRIKNGQE